MTTHVLILPYPPSANANWQHGNGRVYLSERVRQFRREVRAAMAAQRPGSAPVAVPVALEVLATPPARMRRRDLSNLLKATEDALTHAGFWQDDSQIHDLRIRWMPAEAAGRLLIKATELE